METVHFCIGGSWIKSTYFETNNMLPKFVVIFWDTQYMWQLKNSAALNVFKRTYLTEF